MRRTVTILACLAFLVIATASTALAHGPRHRGHAFRHAPPVRHWHAQRYYGPRVPVYAARPRVAAYPVYPVYPVPAYGLAYPQAGIGFAGRNFSFWFQQ